jgi:hypothetical protein
MFFSAKASFFCEWLRGALLIPQSRDYNLEQLFISGACRVCELTLIEAATLSPRHTHTRQLYPRPCNHKQENVLQN